MGLFEVRSRERHCGPILTEVAFGLSQQDASTVESPQDREDTTKPIPHPCFHWVDPGGAHSNSCPYRDRSMLSADRFRQETNRTRASPLPATPRHDPPGHAAWHAEIVAAASTGC